MLLLMLILCAFTGALTSPTPLNFTLPAENPSCQSTDPSGNTPDHGNPWSIGFTCLLTTFLCAWTSVHPNIPPTEISWWTRKKLRIELLVWAIIAPELILSWAMSQWMGARRLACEHKDDGWTVTHGFLLMMSGFCYVHEDGTRHILTYDHASTLDGRIITPYTNRTVFKEMERSQIQQITALVSEKEIQDKSKSNFLSKSVTALQTTWFIVQCIARRAQGLQITELELTTIAIAMLNIFMLFFWWEKPMDLEVPILLHVGLCPCNCSQTMSKSETLESGVAEGDTEEEDMVDKMCKWFWVTGPFAPAWQIISQDFSDIPQSDNRFTVINLSNKEDWARHVVLAISASVFGGLHLVAWTFIFPNRGAWVCWQTAALVIATGPVAMFLMTWASTLDWLGNTVEGSSSVLGFLGALLFFIITILVAPALYILAHLTLLVEALGLLAYIPPNSLKQIDWLRFIPHL